MTDADRRTDDELLARWFELEPGAKRILSGYTAIGLDLRIPIDERDMMTEAAKAAFFILLQLHGVEARGWACRLEYGETLDLWRATVRRGPARHGARMYRPTSIALGERPVDALTQAYVHALEAEAAEARAARTTAN